ncbi:FHA domain-containing protein FhaB/FipA [Streptacidiphilus monticola]|jgi:pSer/pThr/pTyr-binding forkhead associated (FHA) protein|uniref:FHA domain-containing protein n=1 Tax=Streptacidiphilus monticola TaxID=2161674 RepID=A0ABW1G554_9ACTN
MTDLTLTVMRLGFLAVLWLFVIVAVQVIRSDLFGTRVARRTATAQTGRQQPPAQRQQTARQAPPRRGAAAGPTQLVITQGSLAGTTVALQGQTISLGRAHDSTIVLDDDYASSRHARIFQDQSGQWYVEDLNSTNGTFLGNQRLTAPTPLQPGAPIRIGRTVIELRK